MEGQPKASCISLYYNSYLSGLIKVMSKLLQNILVLLITGTLLAVAAFSSYKIYNSSREVAEVKMEYSEVNSITRGILSVNIWRDHLTNIVLNRIDEFEFSEAEEDTLVKQVANILTTGINKGSDLLDQKQKGVKAKLRKFAIKALVSEDKIKALVPVFAQTIVNEIQQPENKDALKFVIKSKIQEYSDMTHANSEAAMLRLNKIYERHEVEDLQGFNQKAAKKIEFLNGQTFFYTFVLLIIIILFLASWWLLRYRRSLHTSLFVTSVTLSLVVLFAGLTAPMIEIDARFNQINFQLIGEQISFNDQVIFFQSKSILEVIGILFGTGKVDSLFVGILILAFSILFPVAKLISTQIYLAGNEKTRKNKLLKFFAFRSGKWSMADVYVIAIFMAYIGFQGIMDNQLIALNRETESLVSIATNKTSLQPGFIIFTAFVLYSLVLSEILKKMTALEKRKGYKRFKAREEKSEGLV